jgi:spore photoproduct lyase
MVLFGNVDEGLGVLSERLDLLNSDPSAFQNLPRDAVRDPGHPGDRPVRPPSPRSHRFCTGEFADSLLLDPLTGLSEKLVGIFARQKLGILELKTKTANVDHLLNLDHRGKTVISFSMNSPKIAKTEEPLAPPPLERAKAAAGAAERGYGVGFHFDPLIWSPDYPEGLRETVSMIFDRVDPGAVAWISMGCFRYLPEMKPLLSKNGAGRLFAPEFAKADDGKFRYPRPLRREMYQCLLDLLRPRVSPATILHLCMESPRLWEDLFGFNPGTGGLTAAFRDFRPPKAP